MNRLLLRGEITSCRRTFHLFPLCLSIERERERERANFDWWRHNKKWMSRRDPRFPPQVAPLMFGRYCPLAAGRFFSPLCSLFSLSACGKEAMDAEWWKEGEKERAYCRACLHIRAHASKRKTTLSKEGFKDYQLRLLGNLPSCILPTSKRPLCAGKLQVGECGVCSSGWGEGRGGRSVRGEGGERQNVIPLINADTRPVWY